MATQAELDQWATEKAAAGAAILDALDTYVDRTLQIWAGGAGILLLNEIEAQQAVAELIRPQIRAAVDQHEANLVQRVLADPTVEPWADVVIVWPPLPAEGA